MKKMIIAVAAMLIMAATAGAQDATFQTKVYKDNGGDRLCVNSGGTITVYSGGDLDLKSGASAYIQAVPNGANVDVSVYGTDTTTLSTTAVNVHVFAGGTP